MKLWEEKFGRKHKDLEHVPELPRSLLWLHNAYIELGKRRGCDAMGSPLYIAVSETVCYAQHVLMLSKGMVSLFTMMIGIIDSYVMSAHLKKMEELEKANKKKQSARR